MGGPMSEKVRTSVSLTQENKAYLDSETNNRSAFINDLIDAHRKGKSDMDEVVARYRREQLEAERRKAQNTVERVESELETIDKQLAEKQAEKEDALDEAREVLADVPKDPENPAIQNWADDLDMTPEELIDEL